MGRTARSRAPPGSCGVRREVDVRCVAPDEAAAGQVREAVYSLHRYSLAPTLVAWQAALCRAAVFRAVTGRPTGLPQDTTDPDWKV